MTYAEKLQSPEWQKKKTEIQIRDKFTCQCCGDTKTQLQVHHKEYTKGKEPWDYPNEYFILLCKHCHELVTAVGEKEMPLIILKKVYPNRVQFVFKLDTRLFIWQSDWEDMVMFYQDEERQIVHAIINHWLQAGNTHLLIDKTIPNE